MYTIYHLYRLSSVHSCTLDAICSVLGPVIIDIAGSVSSIPSRCSYTLMTTADFRIEARFRERRRTDVNFLDSVTMKINSDKFLLEQGGRVYVSTQFVQGYAQNVSERSAAKVKSHHEHISVKLSCFPQFSTNTITF